MLRCQKTIRAFTEKFFSRETTLQRMICTACADDNNNNTHLFFLLSFNKLKSFLLNLLYKIHSNTTSCTVEFWMHLGDVLGGLVSS